MKKSFHLIIIGLFLYLGCAAPQKKQDVFELAEQAEAVKISELPEETSPLSTDEVLLRRSSNNYRAQVGNLPAPTPASDVFHNIKEVYYVSNNSSITDHGNTSQSGSLADVIVNEVAGANANVETPGNKTYNVGTNLTIPATTLYVPQKGAILKPASGVTITFSAGPSGVKAAPGQKIFDVSAGGTITWSVPGISNIEWFGVSTSESAANNRDYANAAIAAAINKGELRVNGMYDIDDCLEVEASVTQDFISIRGVGFPAGFASTATGGASLFESTVAGAVQKYTSVTLRDLSFVGNGSSNSGGDGIVLRRCNGLLENIKILTLDTTTSTGGTAFKFLGCIEIQGGRLWANNIMTGFVLGTYHSATNNNSTNACSLYGLRVNSATDDGILFEGDGTNDLEPQGNLISGFEYGSGSTAKIIHFKAGKNNTFINAWLENGANALVMEDDDDGVNDPDSNNFINLRCSSQAGTEIDIDNGSDNIFTGGYMPSPSQVDIAAGANYNKFLYMKNFPVEAGTLNNSGTGTIILSHGSGSSDSTQDYHSWNMTFANNKFLRWFNSAGNDHSLLGLDSSNRVKLYDYLGNEALRITQNAENWQKNPLVFDTSIQQLSADTTFTRDEGNIFFLTTNGSDYNFNPSGSFLVGATVIIFNLDASHTITFNYGGLGLAIGSGEIAICSYDSSSWRGAVVN